MVESYDSDVA